MSEVKLTQYRCGSCDGYGAIILQYFLGTMAMAIMGGLIAATLLTILFLPALYTAWFKA